MPMVSFIDSDLKETEITGNYIYNPNKIFSEDGDQEITAHISLLSMRKITDYRTRKWEFSYSNNKINVDVSACINDLRSRSFTPMGCIMKVRMIVNEKAVNEGGRLIYRNEYKLVEIIDIDHHT